jgi:hypothetical protein
MKHVVPEINMRIKNIERRRHARNNCLITSKVMSTTYNLSRNLAALVSIQNRRRK